MSSERFIRSKYFSTPQSTEQDSFTSNDGNTDYQWFTESGGYHKNQQGGSHTPSERAQRNKVSALDGHLAQYDALSRTLDVNLAEIDIDTFRSEDLHSALVSTELQVESDGELVTAFNEPIDGLVGSYNRVQSSQDDASSMTDMSLHKSGPLFSPYHDAFPQFRQEAATQEGPDDQVDPEEELVLTLACRDNKTNYKIAFEGMMGSTGSDGDYNQASSETSGGTSDSAQWSEGSSLGHSPIRNYRFGTWPNQRSPIRNKKSPIPPRRVPKLNVENAPDDSVNGNDIQETKSLPNLYKQCLMKNSITKHKSPERELKRDSLSLLQIYMRQKGYGDVQNCNTKEQSTMEDSLLADEVCCDGGQCFIAEYPSSADEKAYDTSVEEKASESDDKNDEITENSDYTSSLVIDAKVFTKCSPKKLTASSLISNNNSSIDRVIAKIQPFGTGPLPSTDEEPSFSFGKPLTKDSGAQTVEKIMKDVATSMIVFAKMDKCVNTDDKNKPVVMVFPNYTLPDLQFLSEKQKANIVLSPQAYKAPKPGSPSSKRKVRKTVKGRPFSCNDIEQAKTTKSFKHIKDWESLKVLLPKEMQEILSGIPEEEESEPKTRPKSCDAATLTKDPPRFFRMNSSGFSSASTRTTSTQPSSGYRGSSTFCSNPSGGSSPLLPSPHGSYPLSPAYDCQPPPLPERTASLPCHDYEVPPPRPPPPRGILRKAKSESHTKRSKQKNRLSLPILQDEQEDLVQYLSETNSHLKAELSRLEATLKSFGLTVTKDTDSKEIRDRVSKMLVIKSHADTIANALLDQKKKLVKKLVELSPPHNTPSKATPVSSVPGTPPEEEYNDELHKLQKAVSFAEQLNRLSGQQLEQKKKSQKPAKWRSSLPCQPFPNLMSPYEDPDDTYIDSEFSPVEMMKKRAMVSQVISAVDKVFRELSLYDDPSTLYTSTSVAIDDVTLKNVNKIVIGLLSPALYQLMSDGLQPAVKTLFGEAQNSVWRVVEAASRKGPSAPWFSELVLWLSSEETLPEGPLRFHAFVVGLLKMGGLAWWLENLAARESVLRRHYRTTAFLYACNTATRDLMEELLASLSQLSGMRLNLNVSVKEEEKKKISQSTASTSSRSSGSIRITPPASPRRVEKPRPQTLAPPVKTQSKQLKAPVVKPVVKSPLRTVEQKETRSFGTLKKQWQQMCDEKSPAKKSTSRVEVQTVASPARSRIPRPSASASAIPKLQPKLSSKYSDSSPVLSPPIL